MSYITLLGDSIIDNKTYVQQGEFSVLEHLENNTEYEFTQIAYDGHTTHDVLNSQLLSPSIDKILLNLSILFFIFIECIFDILINLKRVPKICILGIDISYKIIRCILCNNFSI